MPQDGALKVKVGGGSGSIVNLPGQTCQQLASYNGEPYEFLGNAEPGFRNLGPGTYLDPLYGWNLAVALVLAEDVNTDSVRIEFEIQDGNVDSILVSGGPWNAGDTISAIVDMPDDSGGPPWDWLSVTRSDTSARVLLESTGSVCWTADPNIPVPSTPSWKYGGLANIDGGTLNVKVFMSEPEPLPIDPCAGVPSRTPLIATSVYPEGAYWGNKPPNYAYFTDSMVPAGRDVTVTVVLLDPVATSSARVSLEQVDANVAYGTATGGPWAAGSTLSFVIPSAELDQLGFLPTSPRMWNNLYVDTTPPSSYPVRLTSAEYSYITAPEDFAQFSVSRPSPTDVLVDNLDPAESMVGVAGSVSIDVGVNQPCRVWVVRSWGSGTDNPNQYHETEQEAYESGPYSTTHKRFDSAGNIGSWVGSMTDDFKPWIWTSGSLSSFLLRSSVPDAITKVCVLGYANNE